MERVDAVEAETRYITDRLKAIYDVVLPVNVEDVPTRVLGAYDLILMLDVIEHIQKNDAIRLLSRIKARVLVSTPEHFFQNPEAVEYPTETHVSHWSLEDFEQIARTQRRSWDGSIVNAGIIGTLGPKKR